MRDDHFTGTEADAGLYERQHAMDDYDPPDMEHDEEDATLTEFLLARIAEDETVARAAVGAATVQRQSGRWAFEHVKDECGPIPIVFAVSDSGGKTQVARLDEAWDRDERGVHIARHDPARVIAECEAKRLLIERVGNPDWAGFHILALPYANHPDYRQEWGNA